MGAEDPEYPTNSPATALALIPSKRGLTQLPLPNTICPHNNARSGTSFTIRVTIATLILLWTLLNINVLTSPFKQTHPIGSVDDPSAAGYLRGVSTKGMKWALLAPNHQLQGTYHDGEGTEIREKGIKTSLIPPNVAEKIFLDIPSNDSVAAALKRYTGYAHPAGSGYDYASALTLKNDWEKELGLRVSGPLEFIYDAGSPESQARVRNGMDKLGVWIDTYYPVMNTPVYAAATLLTDPPFHAKLREDIVDGDSDSELRDEVPVFHGLSVSGDVKGNFVYVGYGRKQDFDLLKERGVDINNKIVLAKYGGCFRGLKVKAAQEAGATGVIIFTDPGDDGEITEENGYEVYPNGPARQPSSVQRGSVQFVSILLFLFVLVKATSDILYQISKYPGDPSTPGEPAYKNASRLEGGNQPSIPSIPMSYEDVIPFLKALEGKGIHASDLGPDWVGGLSHHGVDYYVGPSDVDLHLVNEVNTRIMPIWNTMAVIPGHITDEVIILGNHRDAWVLGGSDPNSGTASQFEVIRGLGTLLKKGWKPLRTIILASWDAEEYGLIGSTEWAEDFGDWLQTNTAVYLNMDSSASGSNFHASASPSLALLVKSAAEEVESSSSPSKTVFDTRFEAGNWEQFNMKKLGNHVGMGDSLSEKKGSGIGALGSGSDYTPFLQRYGIASSDLGYKSGPKDAVYHYHSIYDSFTWQKKFGDVEFHRHTDAAKVIGLILLRLADGLILPLNTTQYTRDLAYYLEKVQNISKIDLETSEIDFEPLADAIKAAQTASGKLDKRRRKALKKLHKLMRKLEHGKGGIVKTMLRGYGWRTGGKEVDYNLQTWEEGPKEGIFPFPHPKLPSPFPTPRKYREINNILKEIRIINKKLQDFECGFLSEDGLKDREWYKHKGTAPGLWLGYGATTFPALTEAITIDHSSKLAQKEVDELAKMINKIAKHLAA
ncbi:membrane protein [Cryptococcus gattii EJB2]|uniref:Membrane protein n=1 Tax=Cryptococcus gattii EJB2 TaxID=1296103 RepID=A0ABR5BP76_9TREE|nr:membrane protein [Cryptococcus gattii EJB2]